METTKKYRLYIDESGTHKYPKRNNLWDKCLGLTGVIISQDEYRDVLQPRIRDLKTMFVEDLDDLPIFHRDEMTRRVGCFNKLLKKDFQEEFNIAYLSLLTEMDFTICCVVIDKEVHKNTYKTPDHPYHYCLATMLERYVDFLDKKDAVGDVMAESRGGEEDLALKQIYRDFYDKGTEYRRSPLVQRTLTSRELKMKRKSERVNGLELADLLAIPTKIDVLITYGKAELKENFSKRIIEAIQTKYYRNWLGKVKGYGKKII